jgi:hypothetical protein
VEIPDHILEHGQRYSLQPGPEQDHHRGPLAGIPLHLVLAPKTVTVTTTGQKMVVYVVSLEYRGNEEALAELGYQIARRRIEHQIKMEQIEAEARRLLLPPPAEPPEEQEEVAQEFYPEGTGEDIGLNIKAEEDLLKPVPEKKKDATSLF